MTIWIDKSDRDLIKITAAAAGTTGNEYIVENLKKTLRRDRDLVESFVKRIGGQ